MKIAIIGAGFTGLSAAYRLTKKGHDVFVFEENSLPGGLAIGYKKNNWNWSLEHHYHHWFTNDKNALDLAREIDYKVITKRPKTSVFVKDKIYQLDSPISALSFPLLSIFERLRMGVVIGFLRFEPFWKPLEKYKASQVLTTFMGKNAFEMIWEPLFINKFGKFANGISLAWFWARIQKRTPSLSYPKGGFLEFAQALVLQIEKQGGKIIFNSSVSNLTTNGKVSLSTKDKNGVIKTDSFDKVIVTVPSQAFIKIAPQLPKDYMNKAKKFKNLGATNLILRLKKPFFDDNTYWLSVCDKKAPVMTIVEHTNYIDKKNYNGEHLLYLGNYKQVDDKFFSLTKEELLKLFDPYLKKINPSYSENIIGYELFKDAFAQPVVFINYSKMLPPFKTPLKNVLLSNIEQVYPWDRGTNYAIELGEKIAKLVL